MPLQARPLPPVPPPVPPPEPPVPPVPPDPLPPPDPPVFIEEVEIPEQAVRQTICVNRIASNRGSFQFVPGSRITKTIVRDQTHIRKRPFGHVPIPTEPLKWPDKSGVAAHLPRSTVFAAPIL